MTLFENYNNNPDQNRKPAINNPRIRPAIISDVEALAKFTAEREGGDLDKYILPLERAVTEMAESDQGIILVVEYINEVIGFGKIRYFIPPEDSPDNIAPEGWYLTGIIVKSEFRRRGVGHQLTQARLDWISERADYAYYFANARNRVSIELHEKFGFCEITRDFVYPDVAFTGGEGILFRVNLNC